ncbi:general substrate transporter [Amniculicola lignicola CBS 123094]|uniref:General substrate transporter n=1 Tax=Amniculicola lignicola CBS 123094 TaxID=1392246 RepID=A0A6A5VYI6_9PLEO|nr:general substrate transporter [Amniculicola lignicola CBS 123094]
MSLFRKIHKPPGYVISSILISLGGIINGFDTGSIGAITEMPSFLSTISHLTPLMRGFTVSLIMLTGAFPSFFAGQLANRFGRLAIVMAGSLTFMVGAILQGSAKNLESFLVGRALCGFGEGLWISNVTVYITEIAPSKRRGTLVSLPQFGAAAGVCLGYFTCYGSIRITSSLSWRVPFIIQAIQAAILTCLCLFLPPSPRWLIQHGKRSKALKAIERLGISQVEAEKDILNPIHQQTAAPSTVEGIIMIFRRQYRARTILALFILGMIQLCGIDGVLYYAPTLFAQAGIPTQKASFLASGVSAILMLAISIPAVFYSDRMGRRTSTICGGILLSACMIIIGALYAADRVHSYGIARWVVVVLIFVFALTYCFTWGIVGKIYASEIQPAQTRASANCLAQGLNFFANWLVAFATPVFLARSAFGAYFLFGFLSLGTVAVLASNMPETRGKSLEDIQSAFQQQRPVVGSWLSGLRKWFERMGISPLTVGLVGNDITTERSDIEIADFGHVVSRRDIVEG